MYQKQIQQPIKKFNVLMDKNTRKFLTNIKPMAQKINAYIKRNKENEPIRPVINNTLAPSYDIARFLNNRLMDYINLPGTYTTKNFHETAQVLHNIHIRENHKIITLDIKYLYVNLPTKCIIQITRIWLHKNSISTTIIEQVLHLLTVVLKQNYFQYNNQFFRPDKTISMGSPISDTLAKIYLK
jgi:hypothetical protein